MNDFKKCPNGHYFQGVSCPYCPAHGAPSAGSGETKTQIIPGGDGGNSDLETETLGGAKTQIVDSNLPTVGDDETIIPTNSPRAPQSGTHTVFGDEEVIETAGGERKVVQVIRNTRKLVGWLVTYSHDAMGQDFKLYEGRNIIGRDMDCNITVADNMMSGKHAILLFRADKYSLTDNQSTHGTFVNDEDINLDPRYLKDGDIVKMGSSIFKFRTSL